VRFPDAHTLGVKLSDRNAKTGELTDVDIPFVQDGLRDGEAIRGEMHRKFAEELEGQSVPWRLISGGREARVERALSVIWPMIRTA
jgi:nicotinamide riboside kinase